MLIEIFSIDCKLLSGNIKSVIFPGSDGSFQIFKSHAPIVSTLKKGNIVIEGEVIVEDKAYIDVYNIKKQNKKTFLHIESGLVEMKKNLVKVLID
tara:strand:- start:760 stop:1044 length:285 start_codon:yes stop_codon:yes gene_type:complete